MYRTSTQEPRYKHSLYEREPRHVESKEFSEDYTSSSEEEDESSGNNTEESDEKTIESHESYYLQKRSEWSPAFEQQWSYNKLDKSEKKPTNPYIGDIRFYKQDKVTQKNLLSPFPSFVIPPIPRQVTGQPHYRLQNVGSAKEEQNHLQSSTKYPPKKSKNYKEEEGAICVIHKCHDCKERKVSKKPKVQDDQDYQSNSSDRVFKCLQRESPEESSRNFSKSTADSERLSKQPTSIPTYAQRPKSSTRENTKNQQTMTKFADCTLEHETRGKSRPKTAIGVIPCKKDTNLREAFLARNIGDGKQANKKGGEVKEKLVYVVEEEGKEVTKLETDLFTINEILAIKRDLLELSEFAKKLKKLKEMKKESENTKNKENTCQCKPAEELLKDVNRRIEILEARQEELEKGAKRATQKDDTETESKNTNITKISSGSQSKTPETIQSSATTTVPSFPKTKIFVTRPDGLSKNSDIVKELVDIKTQLQRLKKRRISKEVSNEVVPEKNTKLTSNKNRAIAVFSSKTYIFTSENFDNRNLAEKMLKEEKGKNYITSIEENTNKRVQRKANVASWLKNVKIEQTETDVNMFLSAERTKRKENIMEDPKGNMNVKCRNCIQTLKEKDFENQEPQKNRVLEREERKSDNGFAKLLKNESSFKKINRYIGYKKCMMTPSGKLFALMSESSEKVLNIPTAGKPKSTPAANPQWLQSRGIRRSGSSGSITSAILAKQQVRRLKAQRLADKHCNGLIARPIQSKSLQELNINSNFCEVKKNARNMNNFKKTEASPLPKDGNDLVKYLEAHLMALKKNFEKRDPTTSSCTYSEFLASINLESETSATLESNTLQKNIASNEIYTYMASTKTKLNALESQDRPEENCKESKKENKQKHRKKEKKEKKKSELNKKSIPIKEKKCKELTKQTKCKKKNKKKPHRCNSKNTDHYNFWKNYYGGDFFKYNEKKPISHRPKIPSEDQLEIYGKQQTERSKTNLDCKKQNVDSFTIRNIFKSLGRYYPKISNFHLFASPRGEVCDKKEEEHKISRFSKTRITNKSEDDFHDEDNENDKDSNQTSDGSYACQSLHSNNPFDQGHRHYNSQTTKPDDLKNCRCVQVYLQTQEERGWSGLGPFRTLSAESITKESTSRSTGSCKLKKSESLSSAKKSQIQYVGHSTQICLRKKPKCDKKHKKGRKHKRKCCSVCVCCKCKHGHKCKKKKIKCEKVCKVKSEICPQTQKCSDSKFQKQCFCGGGLPSENSPLFSLFSNFCKSKPRETTLSKSIANKFSEIRYLKTCPRVQTNFFSRLRNHLLVSCDNESRSKDCHCISKLQDIENKLKKLEKSKSCDCCYVKKKKKKKKCSKKMKRKCCCSESLESNYSCHCIECCAVEGKKRNKKKCTKKMKKKCCCSESLESNYSCHCIECCAVEGKKRKKKKCTKKMKKKCCCSESLESNYSCHCIECCAVEGKKRKKKKCTKKMKKKCCCSESLESNYSCHCIECCAVEGKKKKKKKCTKKMKKKCCCSESLESNYSCHCIECCGVEEKKRKKKKKCTKKMKKRCCCSDSPESNYSCNCTECCEDIDKKKMKCCKKCCKKKKKKKHKKHKTKCCCSECKVDGKKCSGAYYYTAECLSSGIALETSTNKTTEEEKKDKKEKFFPVTKSKEILEQTNTRAKEKLPSSTSFWEKLQKYELTKSQSLTKIKNKEPTELLEPKIMFFGECRKGDSRGKKSQGYEMKEDSKTFLKKVTKIKRWGKKTNEKEKNTEVGTKAWKPKMTTVLPFNSF